MRSETLIAGAILLVVALTFLTASMTLFLYGGVVVDAELRDGVLFVERNRGGGWKEIGDPRWIWLAVILDYAAKFVIFPLVLFIIGLGSFSKWRETRND